jgi:8-oxo-dGTP pyrophosphatase MutT (NUDIX family)
MSELLHLVLGGAPSGFRALFAAEGEFARAAPSLARAQAAGLAPEVVLHLYAYELVERLREAAELGQRRVYAPFHPAALFRAHAVPAHAWPELARLAPARLRCTRAPRSAGEIEAWCARLGLPPLVAARLEHVEAELATQEGWPPRWPAPRAPARAIEHATAAGVLVRDGRILLERRPADARVTPDTWDIPGGHVELGEDVEAALRREFREELGLLDLELGARLEFTSVEPPAGRAYRHVVSVVRAARGDLRPRENQVLHWLEPESALRLGDLNPPTAWALQTLLEDGEL